LGRLICFVPQKKWWQPFWLSFLQRGREGSTMAVGNVKWFNATKGYGFVQPEDGSADVFIHISAVQKAGLKTLLEGQRVEYELVKGRNGKAAADNITVRD